MLEYLGSEPIRKAYRSPSQNGVGNAGWGAIAENFWTT